MPELWGAPLPVWAIVLLSLLLNRDFVGLLKRVLSIFGIVAKQSSEAEADERKYQRSRESEMFAVLKSIIDSGQQESKERDQILNKLTLALHKNTDTIARLIDQMRIYGYNAAVLAEKIEELHDTRRLRND